MTTPDLYSSFVYIAAEANGSTAAAAVANFILSAYFDILVRKETWTQLLSPNLDGRTALYTYLLLPSQWRFAVRIACLVPAALTVSDKRGPVERLPLQ